MPSGVYQETEGRLPSRRQGSPAGFWAERFANSQGASSAATFALSFQFFSPKCNSFSLKRNFGFKAANESPAATVAMDWAALSPISLALPPPSATARWITTVPSAATGRTGGNGGNGLGGGIYNDGSTASGVSSLTIAGSTITHNEATGGKGDGGGTAGQGIGGGL